MENIDFVIAWVDGNDPAWQAEKAKYQGVKWEEGAKNIRYRDWDYLHFWFRAVEKYAPWVHKVHLMTWGHIPEWLQTEHPKLHVVKHEEFIPAEYLPTFSSHPIELNMHRIEGLAEQFVYFNDDFFLTAPVKPTDFFVNGLPCDSLEESPLDLNWRNLMVSVNANDVLFLNQQHSKVDCRKKNWRKWYSIRTPKETLKNMLLAPISRNAFFGFNYHHLPQAYLKSTLVEVWKLDPQWFHETCLLKFRNREDVSQCVFKFHQLASGQFYPYSKRKNGKWFGGGIDIEGACRAIQNQQYKFICYNDGDKVDFESYKKKLHAAFLTVLPEKCSFEK